MMVAEEDFQAALDAKPDDWQTRLVFADWLQERGDERADGYRALGTQRKRPAGGVASWCWRPEGSKLVPTHAVVPVDWYASSVAMQINYVIRRKAEDAAAIAFSKLPTERQAELLAAVPA